MYYIVVPPTKVLPGSFRKRHHYDQGRVAEIRTQAIVHHSLWDWHSVVRKDISSNNLYLPVCGRVHLGNRNRVRLWSPSLNDNHLLPSISEQIKLRYFTMTHWCSLHATLTLFCHIQI